MKKSKFYHFITFSWIGVLNTLIHLCIVIYMVNIHNFSTLSGNTIAFIVSNLFSFFANSRWNYKSKISLKKYQRFLFISLLGLCITMLVSWFSMILNLHYLIGTFFVFLALPLFTFILHHKWTWKINK